MSKKCKIVLKSTLVDDYAPDLIRTFVENIDADITLIANLATEVEAIKREFKSYDVGKFNERFAYVKSFVNAEFINTDEFYRTGKGWKARYDEKLLGMMEEINPDYVLDLGYMMINPETLWQRFLITNLHPAIPEVGPIGMWTDVMEQQAERPLEEIVKLKIFSEDRLIEILNRREYRAGGMLALLDKDVDRGPVISWYEFPLISEELLELFWSVGCAAKEYGISNARNIIEYRQLVDKIRSYQYKGENPLIILSYKKLTQGKWKIVESDTGDNRYFKNRTLCVKENDLWRQYPDGYCLNKEIGEWLRKRGISSLIK